MKDIKTYIINENSSLKYSLIYLLSENIKTGNIKNKEDVLLFSNLNELLNFSKNFKDDTDNTINEIKSLKQGDCKLIKFNNIDVNKAGFDSILVSCW